MPRGLSYADAVRILGGKGPLAKAVDNLLGGLLSVATLGGSEAALGFFDAKAEIVRLSSLLTAKINDSVRGLGRHDRSQRLLAAHGVLVVASLFDALDELLATESLYPAKLARADQITLVGTPQGENLMYRLISAKIPAPSADRSYARLLDELKDWYDERTRRLSPILSSLVATADRRSHLPFWLPRRAVERYDETYRRLVEEIPEFAIWAGKLEERAAARGLERLESVLLRATSGRDPGKHRSDLARVYRAELERPVLGDQGGDLVLPALGRAYIDPQFRAKAAGPGARPSTEEWWDTDIRDDIHTFLAAYLTTDQATEAPMLLLGQPGAGKSSLTRILAARLPASDFFVARVPLRDVPAEAAVQNQIEYALREAIGQTVAWAELAEDTRGALPVVLLDGFDELLQATGLHQSDYLQRVAEFQRREAAVGRPVAVMVTSRIAVADWARLPEGGLAVRLEPFDDEQITRWTEVWNRANGDRLTAHSVAPLSTEVLLRFRDLAEQPLLLLMLAIYDSVGNPLRDDAAAFDSSQLYERLLSEFAAREVDRIYATQLDLRRSELIEEELVRLSVVAFAMFNRNRLWISESELDGDLNGLDLATPQVPQTGGFRSPLTAAQEMVGRFFFIQRAQAHRDDRILQTYEFLHATFGEYLIARLLVQTLREMVEHEAVGRRGLRRRTPENDLLSQLLGYTPLSARNTVLSFVSGLISEDERDNIRASLVRRASQAVTRPSYTLSRYQPVDKRIDHWMATYSFNLVLLVLGCGGELRASELFTETPDPSYWLRGTALQWRAAVPEAMWLESLEHLTVRRDRHDGGRDIVLGRWNASIEPIDADWSNHVDPAVPPRSRYTSNFSLSLALKSMHLSNSLSDDTLLHAMEPLIRRLPASITNFVHHGAPIPTTESVAHSLIDLWVTSALDDKADTLVRAYDRAVAAVTAVPEAMVERGTSVLVRALVADARRLPPDEVVRLIRQTVPSSRLSDTAPLLECLLLPEVAQVGETRDDLLLQLLARGFETVDDELVSRTMRDCLADDRKTRDLLIQLASKFEKPDMRERLERIIRDNPDLSEMLSVERLVNFYGSLHAPTKREPKP